MAFAGFILCLIILGAAGGIENLMLKHKSKNREMSPSERRSQEKYDRMKADRTDFELRNGMKLTYPEMIDKVDLLKTKRSPSAQDALNEMREASRERIEERLR